MFLDLALPDMSGLEVMRRVKAEWPNVHVIILTGADEESKAIKDAVAAGGYNAIISKPLHLADLGEIARKHHLTI